ncbi:hypothetical protein AMTRI_Chr12g240270 [Amborella trichopoda]
MNISSPETEAKRARIHNQKEPVCVLDASTYVGFWILKGLLHRGYTVHAAIQNNGESEITRKIREMGRLEERLVVFVADVLDYHSILEALKGCCGLFHAVDHSHNSEGYDERMMELEVRGTINVLEACSQTETVEKIVFSSSVAAAVWREKICSEDEIDERSWSDAEYCRKMKLWYALAKTLSERAAWALAMDRMLNMVSINAALILGPGVTHQNPGSTISYLKGAAQMYEHGVLAYVDISFLVDAHISAFEDPSASGRYFCFNKIVNKEEECIKLVESLKPLISLPEGYNCEEVAVYPQRLRSKKLGRLFNGSLHAKQMMETN